MYSARVCMNFVIGLHYSLKSHDIFVFGSMLAMTFLMRIFSLYTTLCPCVRMWCRYIGVTFNILNVACNPFGAEIENIHF